MSTVENAEIVARYDLGRKEGAEIDEWEDPKFELYHATDRFGFIHDSRLDDKRKEQHKKQIKHEMERLDKWLKMYNNFSTYFGSEKFRSRIYKGIPERIRGKIWEYLLRIDVIKSKQDNSYWMYREHARKYSPDIRQIDLDVNRTYRDHRMFRERFGTSQVALFHVLAAYSVYNTEVGYCQGMNQIAALMLMYMEEEDAFWALAELMTGTRFAQHGIFVAGFPKLKRFQAHLEVILKKYLPKLKKHFDKLQIPLELFSIKWFMLCYLDRVPFSLALRLWDVYLLEGEKILISFAFTIYKMHSKRLLKLKSMEETMDFIQNQMSVDFFGFTDDEVISHLKESMGVLRKSRLEVPTDKASKTEMPQKALGMYYPKVMPVGKARSMYDSDKSAPTSVTSGSSISAFTPHTSTNSAYDSVTSKFSSNEMIRKDDDIDSISNPSTIIGENEYPDLPGLHFGGSSENFSNNANKNNGFYTFPRLPNAASPGASSQNTPSRRAVKFLPKLQHDSERERAYASPYDDNGPHVTRVQIGADPMPHSNLALQRQYYYPDTTHYLSQQSFPLQYRSTSPSYRVDHTDLRFHSHDAIPNLPYSQHHPFNAPYESASHEYQDPKVYSNFYNNSYDIPQSVQPYEQLSNDLIPVHEEELDDEHEQERDMSRSIPSHSQHTPRNGPTVIKIG